MQAEPQSLAANEPPDACRRSWSLRFLSVSIHRTNFLGGCVEIAASLGLNRAAENCRMVHFSSWQSGFALVAAVGVTEKPAAAYPACARVTGHSFICQSNPFAFGCCPVGLICFC